MMNKLTIEGAKKTKPRDPVISPERPFVPEKPSKISPPKKPTIPYLPPEKPAT